MHDALFGTLVEFISRHGGVAYAEKLLTEHQCGPRGKCTCSTPNIYREWPCTSHRAAESVYVRAAARRPVLTRVG